MVVGSFFFFKQKTAYEMRISDWSSDVCSSDLTARQRSGNRGIVMAVTGNWKLATSLILASSLARCAASAPMSRGLPPVQVTASGETQPVGTNRADAADDPAIWVDPANPGHALIVATDKKAGLHVYDLTGKDLAFIEGGLVNNVDIAGDIIVASDRNDGVNAHLARSEEHTSELQSLMRTSYAVFCLKTKKRYRSTHSSHEHTA